MDITQESPVVLSICPGIRGIERGLERIFPKLRTAAYVEIETFIVENLLCAMEAGMVAPAPIWTNLKTFNPVPFRAGIDILMAGYPCQPFSVAGQRNGTDDPRHLWPYIECVIDAVRPVFCFFENVAGHLTMGFPQVYASLRNLGYRVEAGIYTAEETGAPHERERLFILATLADSVREFGRLPEPAGWNHGGKTKRIGKEMANAPLNELHRNDAGGFQRQPVRTGQELGNAYRNGYPERLGAGRYSSQTGGGQKDYRERERLRAKSSSASQELANTDDGRGKQHHQGEWNVSQSSEGCEKVAYRFPAGQGTFQYEWEEPRTVEFPLVDYANGNKNRINFSHINQIYETYTAKKIRAIERLHELWTAIDSQKLQWTIGGLFSFLEEEILFTDLHGAIQNQRLSLRIDTLKKVSDSQKGCLRGMWVDQPIASSPQGQEQIEQLRREFADAMCILSYQITLGGRQDSESGNYDQTMHRLRESFKDSWWNVPKALSEIQEIWRPTSDKTNWGQQIERAYKGYRLELFGSVFGYSFTEDLHRAIGNSVVEQTAELAFRDLYSKLFP